MAKHLLKLKSLEYISRVTVAFNPFDPTSRNARVFLAKIQAGKKVSRRRNSHALNYRARRLYFHRNILSICLHIAVLPPLYTLKSS